MFDGFKFTFKLQGVKARLFGQDPPKIQGNQVPLLEFNLNLVAVLVSIQKELLTADIFLKEILLIQYLRRESMRSFSRQVN